LDATLKLRGRPNNHVRCTECPIRHRAVCADCVTDELELLDQIKSYRTYAPGEVIIWAEEEMDFLGTLVSGVAMLQRNLPDGRRQMVGLLLPSDFVGRPGRDKAPYDVVAASEVTMCRFRRRQFEDLIGTVPSIERRLLQMTLDELDAAREWMLLLGRKSAREKISSFLVILAKRSSAMKNENGADALTFDLPLTREAMADYLGLTIETVSRQLSALRKTGLIVLEGTRHVIIPDLAPLLVEAGDDADGSVMI
jgi:CRP/FNR family transcriptional regulator, anaerobic regulatory protein